MRIAIVNPFDPLPWESQRRGRYSMLAAELRHRGHHVIWLTADFQHTTKNYRNERESNDPGLDIRYIHVPSYTRNIGIKRIWSHIAYAKGVRTLLTTARCDAVISSIPPIGSTYYAMRYCADTKKIGVVDMQDAWPQVLELGLPSVLRGLFHISVSRLLKNLVRSSTNRASALVAVSDSYLSYLASFRTDDSPIPRVMFPLGFDTTLLPVEPETTRPVNASNSWQVVYIGTFGRFYDLDTVIRAASLCTQHNISFTLIGDGPAHDSIVTSARELNLTNVTFTGRLPFEKALPLLKHSHVGLVPLTVDWPPSVPNKVFDYLSVGLPVVFSTAGDLEIELCETGLGLKYEAGNPESLATTLIQLSANPDALIEASAKHTSSFKSRIDGSIIYGNYASFIESLIPGN